MNILDKIFNGKLSISKPNLIHNIEANEISAQLVSKLITSKDISVLKFGKSDIDIHFQRENYSTNLELPPILFEPLLEWDELTKNEHFRTAKQEQDFRSEFDYSNSIIQYRNDEKERRCKINLGCFAPIIQKENNYS